MKKLLILLAVSLVMAYSGNAQEKVKIGENKAGKLIITNMEGLRALLLKSLGHSGTLAQDYQVSTAPGGDRCLVYFTVEGNSSEVSAIGILLVKMKNDYYVVSSPPKTEAAPGVGGSLEIQCSGSPCSSCLPVIVWEPGNWMPRVNCECMPPSVGNCNMTSKTIIKIEL